MTETPEPKPAPSAFGRLLSGNRAGIAALAMSALALIISLAPYASGTDFGSRVKAYLIQNPEVLQDVSAALDLKAQQQQIVENRQKTAEINATAAANPGLLAVDRAGSAIRSRKTGRYLPWRCAACAARAA